MCKIATHVLRLDTHSLGFIRREETQRDREKQRDREREGGREREKREGWREGMKYSANVLIVDRNNKKPKIIKKYGNEINWMDKQSRFALGWVQILFLQDL